MRERAVPPRPPWGAFQEPRSLDLQGGNSRQCPQLDCQPSGTFPSNELSHCYGAGGRPAGQLHFIQGLVALGRPMPGWALPASLIQGHIWGLGHHGVFWKKPRAGACALAFGTGCPVSSRGVGVWAAA